VPHCSHFRNQAGGIQSKLQLSLNSWTSYQPQPHQWNLSVSKEAKDQDGTATGTRTVGRGGYATRVKALLPVDAADCWHLLRWRWSGFLGALPPSLWLMFLSILLSP